MPFSNRLEELEREFQNLAVRIAYSYRRISSPEQLKGTGLIRQADTAAQYCIENRLRLDETLKLSDEGVSAFKGDNVLRGKLGKFLELVDKGKVKRGSILLVENLDRITRQNVLDAQELFLGIINRGITIVTLMDRQVYSREEIQKNPWKLMISLSVMIRANEESEVKSERVSKARQKRRDKATNGQAFKVFTPPWCDFVDGQYKVSEQKRIILKRIFQMYLGGKGPQMIASILNKEGVSHFGRGSAHNYKDETDQWYKKYIVVLLKDKRLIGYAHWIDKPDYFPPALSSDLFNRVQYRLAERKRPAGQIGKGILNIFAGIMRCGHCGSAVCKTRSINREKYEYFYLVCEGARSGKKRCQYRSIPYEAIEESFLYLIRYHPWFREELKDGGVGNERESRIETLKGESLETQKQIAKLGDLIMREDNPPKTIVGKLKELEGKVETLKKCIALEEGKEAERVAMDEIDEEFFLTLPDKMKNVDFRYKVREVIRSMVNRITLYAEPSAPYYHVERTNGKFWSVVFLNTKRTKLEFQISRGINTQINPKESSFYKMESNSLDLSADSPATERIRQLFGTRNR